MNSIADTHKMMYQCGLEVLHPGGLDKTDEMARTCGVGEGNLVLDIGGGRGTTACHLARTYRCKVVGIDISPDMIDAARERAKKDGLEDLVTFRIADAYELPFEDGSFDIVLVECVTTLLDRRRAFVEFARVLTTGGRLGDLEMIYQNDPSEAFARKVSEMWDGFTTMTLEGWRTLFEIHGLKVVAIDDFSDRLANFPKVMMHELGLRGIIRVVGNVLVHPDTRQSVMGYLRIFKEAKEIFGYAYLVGVKT